MGTTWEYKRELGLDNEQMKALGSDGWELVNILSTPTNVLGSDARGPSISTHASIAVDVTTIVSFWKRPKPAVDDKEHRADITQKVRGWLTHNGYPLEMSVASEFASAMYQVEQSTYYEDTNTQEPRELDVVADAYKFFKTTDVEVALRLTAIVECKQNPKSRRPWVVFTAPHSVAFEWSQFDFELFSTSMTSTFSAISNLSTHALFTFGERSGYSVVSPPIGESDSGKNDLAYAAVVKLADAAYQRFRSVENSTEWCTMVMPILAVSTPLLECHMDSAGQIQLTERDELPLLWKRPINASNRPLLIRIVHKAALAKVASRGAQFLEYLQANWTADASAALYDMRARS